MTKKTQWITDKISQLKHERATVLYKLHNMKNYYSREQLIAFHRQRNYLKSQIKQYTAMLVKPQIEKLIKDLKELNDHRTTSYDNIAVNRSRLSKGQDLSYKEITDFTNAILKDQDYIKRLDKDIIRLEKKILSLQKSLE